MPDNQPLTQQFNRIIQHLKIGADPKNVEGMFHFGIRGKNVLGTSVTELRRLAKTIPQNHELAQMLWDSEIHEARILSSLVDQPDRVSRNQMDDWVRDFDSWDLCDQLCNNLFRLTDHALDSAIRWSECPEEFVKRAGFTLMAVIAAHSKDLADSVFENLLPIIKREACDDRNFVKKAVNWALRVIGKRNLHLNGKAIKTADEIHDLNSKSAHWIACDALRELKSEKVQQKLMG